MRALGKELNDEQMDEVAGGVTASASAARGDAKRKFGQKVASAAEAGKAIAGGLQDPQTIKREI